MCGENSSRARGMFSVISWEFPTFRVTEIFGCADPSFSLLLPLPITFFISTASSSCSFLSFSNFLLVSLTSWPILTQRTMCLLLGYHLDPIGCISDYLLFAFHCVFCFFSPRCPLGLANGGLFNFAAKSSQGQTDSYSTGFSVAQQLISVAIGLT